MTTKTLTGTYPSGYTVSANYSALTVAGTGVVHGATVTTYGDFGQSGLVADDAITITDDGVVGGSAGAVGARSPGKSAGGEGGGGGVGLVLGAAASVFSNFLIYGGGGAAGGEAFGGGHGGSGGDAINAVKSLYLNNSYNIVAGAGGAGGEGTYGGVGGAGGAGVSAAAGGYVVNVLLLDGGAGGDGGAGDGGGSMSAGGAGANGGAGVTMAGVGTVGNTGTISGGAAGLGGSYNGVEAASGYGGAGVVLAKGGTVNNSGHIEGGTAAGGAGGRAGVGIVLGGAGVVNSDGTITGAYGGYNGHGSGGIYFEGRGTLDNSGVIQGGEATGKYRQAGLGVLLGDGGSIENTGTIEVDDIKINGTLYGGNANGVVMSKGGEVTNAVDGYIRGYWGVEGSGDATLTNYGRILGLAGFSAYFFSASGRLICEPGSDLLDFASGGSVATVELAAATGTISGLGELGTVSVAETATFAHFAAYDLDAGGNWTFTGTNIVDAGRSLTSEAALAFAAGASLTLDNGATFAAEGAVANSQVIAVQSTGSATDIRVLAAGVTLSGGGTVGLSGAKAEILGTSAAATLTNVGNTILGAGFLGEGIMTLDNEAAGVIEAPIGCSLTVDTKGETLANAGLMEATGGGTLVIDATTVRQQTTGTILAATGSRVDLEDAVVSGGTITSSGSELIAVNVAGGEFDGSAGAITLTGLIEVLNGSNLILNGAIVNKGKLNAYPAGTTSDLIIGPKGASLSGGGQIGLINVNNRVYGQSAADTLTNVNDRIDGAGQLGDGEMVLVNEAGGVIVGNIGSALTIDTGTAAITNAGIIENVGSGGVVVTSAIASTGTLFAADGTLKLEGAVTGAGIGKVNGGTLEAGSTFSQNVDFTGTTGVLELAHSQSYAGTISGFSKSGGTSLDLEDISFTSGVTTATFSGTSTSGILTVTNGTQTATIKLAGDYLGSTFTTANDGHGGTSVVDPVGAAAALRFVEAAARMAPAGAASALPVHDYWPDATAVLARPGAAPP